MYYRLLIVKVETNPAFDLKAAEEWDERQRRGYNYGDPYTVQREIGTRQLDVILTETEFEAIKRAVMQAWT